MNTFPLSKAILNIGVAFGHTPDPAMRSGPSRLSRTSVAKLQRLEFEDHFVDFWMVFFPWIFNVAKPPKKLRIRGGSESLFWWCTYDSMPPLGVLGCFGFVMGIRILWCLKGQDHDFDAATQANQPNSCLTCTPLGLIPDPLDQQSSCCMVGVTLRLYDCFFDVSCIDLQQFYKFSVNTPDMICTDMVYNRVCFHFTIMSMSRHAKPLVWVFCVEKSVSSISFNAAHPKSKWFSKTILKTDFKG